MTDRQLDVDRDLILAVVKGAVSAESHSILFDDDVVLFAVRRVEQQDPTWLLAQLADPVHPLDGRAQIAGDTCILYEQVAGILRAEDATYFG